MSKKHETSKNQKKHTCGGIHSRLQIFSGLFLGIILNEGTFHLHLDEQIESTIFYHNTFYHCDDEDPVVVDLGEIAEKIAEQTGVDQQTVCKILTAEDAYLTELGICETADVEKVLNDKESLKEVDEKFQEGGTTDDDQPTKKPRAMP